MTNYEIIDNILRREGSTFTNDPADRGGATKYGITQRTWDAYCARTGRPSYGVAQLTEHDARQFYWMEFVAPLSAIENDDLRELVIDSAVQHGATRAIRWLQQAAGATVDGVLGPKTLALVNDASDALASGAWQRHLYTTYLRLRLKFYAQIATDQMPADPDAKFLRGWIERLSEFIR